MKKISIVKPKPTLNITTSTGKYYGVRFFNSEDPGDRGFITRTGWNSGNFIIRAIYEVTNGNGWSQFESSNLDALIHQLLRAKFSVFEFDNCQELSLWLATNDVA